MKHFGWNVFRVPALLVFLTMTVAFAWTFAFAPFSEFLNSLILNGSTTLSALIAACIFTFIPFYFQPDEPPRVIWISFASSMWLWTIAEAIWGYLYIRDGEVAIFSFADVFWLLGYVAFTVSFARQIRLILFSRTNTVLWSSVGVWLGVIVSITAFLFATRADVLLGDFFLYFYLLADFIFGLLALYLVYAFRGRALAIPWLTLSSFVVSDFIYIHLTESGVYDYVMSGISIGLVADTLYVIAYLLVAWGGVEQYLLLRSNTVHSQADG